MRLFVTLAATTLAASFVLAQPGLADTKPQSKMQVCAAQWQQMKAANKTNGQDYKTFSSSCMKSAAAAPPAAAAAPKPAPAAMAKPATTPKPATVAVAKPAPVAMAKPASGMKPQDRMKACGAQWQQLKASGKTGGQTYQQFSSVCLKSK